MFIFKRIVNPANGADALLLGFTMSQPEFAGSEDA